MRNGLDSCPPQAEWVAEQYCLNRLSREMAYAFEDHYLTCPLCAAMVTETQEFIDAIRAALPENDAQGESAGRCV